MLNSVPIAIALGSNQGDRMAALRAAVDALAPYVEVQKISPVYETPAAYVEDQPAFLNTTVVGTTKLPPTALLWNIKKIEIELGRTPTFRFGPRVIDIDIIFYGDEVVETAELTIPHKHAHEREFVLRPLADIAPEWKHAQSGKTVAEMLTTLPENTATRIGTLAANDG
jgi:2-amino-4-hydroxy-6-hydroxymethyldihydropteridine diphosphokinase